MPILRSSSHCLVHTCGISHIGHYLTDCSRLRLLKILMIVLTIMLLLILSKNIKIITLYNVSYRGFILALHSTLWGIKNCTLLTGTITLQNYAIVWWFLAYRCTWEYPNLWPPSSPDLNTVDYRMSGVLQKRVYRKSVKNWTLMKWWTEGAPDWSVAWHPAKCRWSGNWRMASSP